MIIAACAFVTAKKPFVFNKKIFMFILSISLYSLIIYQLTGYPQAYRNYLFTTEINQLTTEIQARLEKYPSSREGWYLLGKLYSSQNRPAEANAAFARAAGLDKKQK
jgi:cytochrome c-type biogenesis protein CcmH/NrfG